MTTPTPAPTPTPRLHPLPPELITTITSFSPLSNEAAYTTVKATTERNLRHKRYHRTNLFTVQESLNGLSERLCIVNRASVAEALDERVRDVKGRVGDERALELLAFLQGLAGGVEGVDQLASLRQVEERRRVRRQCEGAEDVDWRDVVRGADEEEAAWANGGASAAQEEMGEEGRGSDVRYSSFSSSSVEQGEESEREDLSDGTGETSVHAENENGPSLEGMVLEIDASTLDAVKEAQKWRTEQGKEEGYAIPITEVQVVRELLHMLRGLPSTLFEEEQAANADHGPRVQPRQGYYIDSLSTEGYKQLLTAFAVVGNMIRRLQQYVDSSATASPLQQTFARCVEERLLAFKSVLSDIERSFAQPKGPTPVSLFDVQMQIESASSRLSLLDGIVRSFCDEDAKGRQSYVLLDRLYDSVCETQAIGDDCGFGEVSSVFLECLTMYLRPLQTWVTRGLVQGESSFFTQRREVVDVASFWDQQYILAIDKEGQPLAPSFLRALVPTLFSLGKQVAFLRVLGMQSDDGQVSNAVHLELSSDLDSLTPFSMTLAQALQQWLDAHRQHSSDNLCQHLLHDQGLMRTLAALSHIYLSRNGIAFQDFADGLISRLDAGKRNWADPLAVESIAKQAFAEVQFVDVRRLAARRQHSRTRDDKGKSEVRALENVNLTFTIAPPLQNIIWPEQIATYQAVQRFLLQLHVARSRLAKVDGRSILHPIASLPLRQRLIHLLSTITSHVFNAGIAPAETLLNEQLQRAAGVAEMNQAHERFVGRLRSCCFMKETSVTVRSAILTIADLAVAFARAVGDQQLKTAGQAVQDVDSSDEEGSESTVTKDQAVSAATTLSPAQLRQMAKQFLGLQSLLIAGLRSASRDQGDSDELTTSTTADGVYGMLAEELEASVVSRRHRGGPV